MASRTCRLLIVLMALTLGGCYTRLQPPGIDAGPDRFTRAPSSVTEQQPLHIYHYYFDAHRAYDPFGPYAFRYRDPWRFQSAYYPAYRYYADPYYSPYLDAVRHSFRWFGGPAIWSPVGVIVDARWLPYRDSDAEPLASPRPRIRRSGFEGLPVPASEVRQTAPTTTYTPPSSPPPAPTPSQQAAPAQTQPAAQTGQGQPSAQQKQAEQKKKDDEQSKEEKREEKRDEQRRRGGMR